MEYIIDFPEESGAAPRTIRKLTRCKDCRHRPLCEKLTGGKISDLNWFCADGDREPEEHED